MSIRQFQAQRMQAPRDFIAIPSTPICVEIGAGKGKHALLFTGQNPHTTLYAIERTKEKFLAMQNSINWNRVNISIRFMPMLYLGWCMPYILHRLNNFYSLSKSRAA